MATKSAGGRKAGETRSGRHKATVREYSPAPKGTKTRHGRHKATPKGTKTIWQDVFLAEYAQCANVALACRKAGVNRQYAYKERAADADFALRWKHARAEAVDTLEAEAWRRARDGTPKPVYQQGRKVGAVQEYSDTLMIFLLKSNKPRKYRERVNHEHSGPNGGNIPISVKDMEEVRAKRWQQAAPGLAAVAANSVDGGEGEGD